MNDEKREGHAQISISEYDKLKWLEGQKYYLEDRVKYLEKAINDIVITSIMAARGPVRKCEIHYEDQMKEPMIVSYDEMEQILRIYLKEAV